MFFLLITTRTFTHVHFEKIIFTIILPMIWIRMCRKGGRWREKNSQNFVSFRRLLRNIFDFFFCDETCCFDYSQFQLLAYDVHTCLATLQSQFSERKNLWINWRRREGWNCKKRKFHPFIQQKKFIKEEDFFFIFCFGGSKAAENWKKRSEENERTEKRREENERSKTLNGNIHTVLILHLVFVWSLSWLNFWLSQWNTFVEFKPRKFYFVYFCCSKLKNFTAMSWNYCNFFLLISIVLFWVFH